MNLDDRVACEIARQDLVSTYGTDRDGVRLALACMQDELDEALEAFQAEKRPIDGRTWARTQDELVQAVAVGLRALRDLSGLNHGAPTGAANGRAVDRAATPQPNGAGRHTR